MNLNNASLAVCAGLPSQLIKSGIPQAAFSGRSNVGKSSLINRLLRRKALARTSSQPGKTVTVNYYSVDGEMYLVDLPGYGFAKRSDAEKKRWSKLVESYFTDNPSLRLVVQLVDLKVGITRDDADMLDWLYETKTPFIVAATKADKLSVTARKARLEELKNDELIPDDVPVIAFSALSGEGRDELAALILG
ncbi:MAG: YihA family ribosome biogenesis GTP-binding protein [Clostridia bacterium]|nr:YihA family ribosome biogenesis GTP-binding protein [Clostridia bacterium]